MNAPEFIRVAGVLYRARREAMPEFVTYMGAKYRLAALPQVQSDAMTAVYTMQRALHDANVDESTIQKLSALRDALVDGAYPMALKIWHSIHPSILRAVGQLEGVTRTQFGRAALDLDDELSSLARV